MGIDDLCISNYENTVISIFPENHTGYALLIKEKDCVSFLGADLTSKLKLNVEAIRSRQIKLPNSISFNLTIKKNITTNFSI